MLHPHILHKHAYKHNNKTKSLTFTANLTFIKHEAYFKQPKPKTVRTVNFKCACVTSGNGSSDNLSAYPSGLSSRQSLMSECCLLEDEGKCSVN